MSEFSDGWNRWRQQRWAAVDGEFGIAALVATHWLSTTPQALPGLPGEWHVERGDIVGDDLTIEAGGEALLGGVLLKHMQRDDQIALRVFDPDSPGRTSLDRIDVFPLDAEWKTHGVFTPAVDESVGIEAIDGYVQDTAVAGHVRFEIGGESASFVVTGEGPEKFATFGDATNGVDTYGFRFLRIRVEGDDGAAIVDFNRAYLPNCAFADGYVCPLPPASNRLHVRVPAGERAVVRGD
ncbi:hypothetical protein GCM10010988_36090 [Cnuibacter physcomitrellae]|uniref:Uncharacterized protein n=1 Tax=Cnuibacter physcomitrellae TaxID=1619308 RepID=A0A1X9LNU4_9MICO|nr:DUF1684 domain-containing protein [Cnuibacter physcomitrellae]ARJ04799.1 hypothetical protein B5808_05885 [Cnuibacter physcomitrellae]GGI41849.1 hypothetical protein GCM10010988_36090 [Cnuibacter physcomitrellae]